MSQLQKFDDKVAYYYRKELKKNRVGKKKN